MENEKTRAVLDQEYFTQVFHVPFDHELYTMAELLQGPFTSVDLARKEKIDRLLREVEE